MNLHRERKYRPINKKITIKGTLITAQIKNNQTKAIGIKKIIMKDSQKIDSKIVLLMKKWKMAPFMLKGVCRLEIICCNWKSRSKCYRLRLRPWMGIYMTSRLTLPRECQTSRLKSKKYNHCYAENGSANLCSKAALQSHYAEFGRQVTGLWN